MMQYAFNIYLQKQLITNQKKKKYQIGFIIIHFKFFNYKR